MTINNNVISHYRWARIRNNKNVIGTLACALSLTALNTYMLLNSTWSTGVAPTTSTIVTASAAIGTLSALVRLQYT
jgi:hypothetical protein